MLGYNSYLYHMRTVSICYALLALASLTQRNARRCSWAAVGIAIRRVYSRDKQANDNARGTRLSLLRWCRYVRAACGLAVRRHTAAIG